MNFVAQLEDYLRDLGAEARKKHPGVKEASERAILKLRTLQNAYVGAVRKASVGGDKHPDTTIFRSSDLLHPFLLAANYPNASPKLLDTSFKAMKTLMEANAICPGDGMNLVRVWMIQAQVVVSYSTKDTSGSTQTSIGASVSSSKPSMASPDSMDRTSDCNTPQSTAGSWFGSFLSSSSSTTKDASNSTTHAVSTRTAVSSSHGQAGSGHLNAKDLEKIALDILSCMLQLLELRELPVSNEQWIQSITLCCMLYLPSLQTVRQAAHSTLPQVLTLLVKDEKAEELAMATWEDLLTCTMGLPAAVLSSSYSDSLSSTSSRKNLGILRGAFSHCRTGEKDAVQPPSPSLSLDLMTILLKEAPFVFARVGQKTLGVVVQVLQRQSSNATISPMEYLRILQFVLVVLQTQSKDWPTECQELVVRLLQPIPQASEALRKEADFEDGFIYKMPNRSLQSSTSAMDTVKGVPPTLLWKAALTMDTLRVMVHDMVLRPIWKHEQVVVRILEAASDFCTIGASCEDHMNLVVLACRKKELSLAYTAESLSSMELWKKGKGKDESYILGEAVWTGLNTILEIIEHLDEKVLDQAFAPSLAVLQHYLKRFPGSGTIVERALGGYFSLAKISLKLPLIRRALLTSLCKLSLPQWGMHDPSCMLRDHNIAALICLLNIIHRFYDSIGPEWSIILQTFQELSVLPIASPHLSDSAYVGALSISAAYSRFPSFSTCLSGRSLLYFVDGLREVSQFEQTPNIISSPVGGADLLLVPTKYVNAEAKEDRETIGKTLMSMGVRAIYGAGSPDDGNVQQDDIPLAGRTKNTYSHDYQSEFACRVAGSKHPLRVHQVPFTFSLLVDVAMSNSFRSSSSGAAIYRNLCRLASDVPSVRYFSMDAIAMLTMTHLAGDDAFPTKFIGPGKIMYHDPRQNQYLAVESAKNERSKEAQISQEELLAPLCECIRNVEDAVVAEAAVEALHAILESCGHDLRNEAWTTVIQAVATLPSEERSSVEWSSSCLSGFRCLKLIVDDFAALTDPSTGARSSLLDCCASFGASQHDVNTSLTAIGLLWTIADQDTGMASIDLALSKLTVLCSDTRAEVRNCAVNTFFSCIAGRGQAFSKEQWRTCICEMVFGVYERVTAGIDSSENRTTKGSNTRKPRYVVSVHHSRDSAGKQWLGTQSLVLRGLCRLMRNFFAKLLDTTDDGSDIASKREDTPWFEDAWNKILGYAFDAATQVGGRDTLDLRTAGSELLVLCSQLSCKQGVHAAITPARVGTNMQVVNGSLRSVRSPDRPDGTRSSPRHSHSIVTDMWRENLFLDAFDVLDSFREHLESDASNHHESGLHHTLEPTEVQVLSKFAEDMGRLYDCCKNYEFMEEARFDKSEELGRLLEIPKPRPGEGDPLVARFVQIIATVAIQSSSGPGSRFLSQAQRSCMGIFRSMASIGSPEALLTLSELAADAVFVERDDDDKVKKGVDILAHEASTILEKEFSNDSLTDVTRTLVVSRILAIFVDDLWEGAPVGVSKSYKLLASLLSEGLPCAMQLEERLSNDVANPKTRLLDGLWGMVLTTLKRLLIPTYDTASTENESVNAHATDLVEIVTVATETTPQCWKDEICSVLASGTAKCLEVAEESPGQRDASLELFTACLKGVCRIDAEYRILSSIAEQVLSSTITVLSSMASSSESLHSALDNVSVQACLRVCQVMQQVSDVDAAAIAIFPQLCRLVGTELTELRRAAGDVLSQVNVGQIIAESDALRSAAEERSVVAEVRVVELTKEMEQLRDEKKALERQLELLSR